MMSTLTLVRGGATCRPRTTQRVGSCDQHPTFTAGCRPCQIRNNARRRQRTRQIAYGTWQPGRVPAAEAHHHCRNLIDNHNMSARRIAVLAKVGRGSVDRIANNPDGYATPDTIKALLAVQPTPPAGHTVPAIGAARRFQALAVAGYDTPHIAAHLGVHYERIQKWRAHTNPMISRHRHEAIAELAERLAITPGPSRRARTIANRHGWVALAAWDDIDNPDEQPFVRDPAHQIDPRYLIRRVLAGTASIDLLTLPEQGALWNTWAAKRTSDGLSVGAKSFARKFGVTRYRAQRIREDAEKTTPTAAAHSRTSERTAA